MWLVNLLIVKIGDPDKVINHSLWRILAELLQFYFIFDKWKEEEEQWDNFFYIFL